MLQNLVRAARINARRQLLERTVGIAVAVNNAIDLAFGGKGRPLQAWLDIMAQDDLDVTAQSQRLISERARQFLAGLPVRRA